MIRRRAWLLGAAATALSLPALRAADQPAAGAGPISGASAGVGEAGWIDFDWTDPGRRRDVPARLYMPQVPQRHAPLVVFSHGLGGSRQGYSYLGRFLAQQGVAALHVQHVGSDRRLWGGGSPLELLSRIRAAASEDEARARAADVRFALDQLAAGSWSQRLDMGRVVAAGHSYGANTSMLLAGATVRRAGETIELRDARVRAAVLISAPPFFGERSADGILGPVTVPSLHITATGDVIRIPGYFSGVEDRLSVFDAIGSARKCLAVFKGGTHSVFTDRLATGGLDANRQIKAATCELVHAFLRETFDGDARTVQSWPVRHQTLLDRFEARVAPGRA